MKNRLDNVILSYPCPIDWDSMEGDDYKRFCNQCSLNVYNLSSMEAQEAEKFLAENEKACIRFYQRKDGTIKTKDCRTFVEKTRLKLSNAKRAFSVGVAFLSSILLSAPGFDAKSSCKKSIKSLWKGSKRSFEYPGRRASGMPVYGEVRLAIDEILPQFDYLGELPRDEANLLTAFKNDLEMKKTINPVFLKKLKDFYGKDKEDKNYYSILLLEALLADENPTLDKADKSEKVEEFEKLRSHYLQRYYFQATHYFENGDVGNAVQKINKLINIALDGYSFKAKDYRLPSNLKRWKYPESHPWAQSTEYKTIVLSDAMLTKSLAILEKGQEVFDSHSEFLIKRLKAARLFEKYNVTKDEKILDDIRIIEGELELMRKFFCFKAFYLGKFVGVKTKDDEREPKLFRLDRKFEPVRKIKGEEIEDKNFYFADYELHYKTDDKTDPYKLERFKSFIPEKNSEWIILSSGYVDSEGSVLAGLVLPARKSTLELIQKLSK